MMTQGVQRSPKALHQNRRGAVCRCIGNDHALGGFASSLQAIPREGNTNLPSSSGSLRRSPPFHVRLNGNARVAHESTWAKVLKHVPLRNDQTNENLSLYHPGQWPTVSKSQPCCASIMTAVLWDIATRQHTGT